MSPVGLLVMMLWSTVGQVNECTHTDTLRQIHVDSSHNTLSLTLRRLNQPGTKKIHICKIHLTPIRAHTYSTYTELYTFAWFLHKHKHTHTLWHLTWWNDRGGKGMSSTIDVLSRLGLFYDPCWHITHLRRYVICKDSIVFWMILEGTSNRKRGGEEGRI